MTKLKLCSLIVFPLFFVAGWIAAEAQSQAGTSTQPPTEALVTLNMTVIDSSGHPVTDLRKEDLELFDEGNPETISYFSKETPPVIYGLLIDNSGSLKNQLRTIVHAAQQIVAANLDNDETFIV